MRPRHPAYGFGIPARSITVFQFTGSETRLRILFAAPPGLLTSALRIIHRVVVGFLLQQAGLKHTTANTGAVTLIQRFGSAANLNIHQHCLMLDGVYRRTEVEPVFRQARAPTGSRAAGLLDKNIARLLKQADPAWLSRARAGHDLPGRRRSG